MNAIYIGCHLCHAQVGQPCRWGVAEGEYHERRVRAAADVRLHQADTEHGLQHGEACTGHREGSGLEGICTVCGQDITRLKNIPALLA